jgi:hypothetical protein
VPTLAKKLLIVVSWLALATGGCTSESQTEVLLECKSRDGQDTAVFYRELGGGAAGWQYEAVLVRAPNDEARTVVLKLKGGYQVALRWLEPKRLEIGYPDSARVDHWQSWFGRFADGHIELRRLNSKDGGLTDPAPACVS